MRSYYDRITHSSTLSLSYWNQCPSEPIPSICFNSAHLVQDKTLVQKKTSHRATHTMILNVFDILLWYWAGFYSQLLESKCINRAHSGSKN